MSKTRWPAVPATLAAGRGGYKSGSVRRLTSAVGELLTDIRRGAIDDSELSPVRSCPLMSTRVPMVGTSTLTTNSFLSYGYAAAAVRTLNLLAEGSSPS